MYARMHAMTITQLFGGNLWLSSSWLLILLIFLILSISISSEEERPADHNHHYLDHHDHEVDVDLVPSSSSSGSKDVDFIRSRCGETLYPDLCYTSLSGYAYAVQKDPAVLTRIAIGLTLFRATRLLGYASNLSSSSDHQYHHHHHLDEDDRTAAAASSALQDCISVMGDAVDQIRGSLKQMRRLIKMNLTAVGKVGPGPGDHDQHLQAYEALRFGLSDVQTWMSAALTNEDTCTEGLEEIMIGDHHYYYNWEEELSYRATNVKRVTSNALALLNGYVANLLSSPPPSPN